VAGRRILAKNQNHYGTIGTGISDAISFAIERSDYRYVSGSVHNHVLCHQTVIGQETISQLKEMGTEPTIVIGCIGGGSNFAGMILPFIREGIKASFIGAESDASPRFTRGMYKYDYSDPAGETPLVKSYTLGRDFLVPPTHIGGLRQHSGSPILGAMYSSGLFTVRSYSQEDALSAGEVLAKTERLVVAPETCHAIKAAIDVALEAEMKGKRETIVVCVSGSGILDTSAYAYLESLRMEQNGTQPRPFVE
jgi:tryptophan synthase beta chain